jgi:hypothetical protein
MRKVKARDSGSGSCQKAFSWSCVVHLHESLAEITSGLSAPPQGATLSIRVNAPCDKKDDTARHRDDESDGVSIGNETGGDGDRRYDKEESSIGGRLATAPRRPVFSRPSRHSQPCRIAQEHEKKSIMADPAVPHRKRGNEN